MILAIFFTFPAASCDRQLLIIMKNIPDRMYFSARRAPAGMNDYNHIGKYFWAYFHLGGGRQELIIIITMKDISPAAYFSSPRTPAGINNYN